MTPSDTSRKILSIAREILASEGVGGVSFDAIARRLGRSKQAVLYWYPTKQDLLAAMFLPWLEAEAETAAGAVAGARSRDEAVAAFVRSVAAFHLDDLDRFRLMYLALQTAQARSANRGRIVPGDKVYPVTDRLYGSLAGHLPGPPEQARREAVAIHCAVLGLVLMHGFAEAVRDPLKHGRADLIEALVQSMTSR